VMLSFSACFVWTRLGPRVLAVFMTLANAACVVWTYSRGGWLGLVLGLFVMAVLLLSWWSVNFSPFWRKWAVPFVLGGLGGFLAVAVIGVPALRLRVLSMFVGRGDSSNNFRINVWTSAIEMIKAKPILGIGPGHGVFNKIYPLYQKPRFTALSAYSIFLETLVETGVIGFTVFIWMLVVVFTQGWRQLQRLRAEGDVQAYWLMGAIATLPGELGQGLFDTVFYRPEVNTLWWMSVALIASFYVPKALPSEREETTSIAQAHG
jgi:putative inorganic carbon (hco3(-)) transporter